MNFPTSLIEFVRRFKGDAKKTARLHQANPLEFQKLEQRTMLAGDVTVFVDGFNLQIIGDDNDNQIQIIGTVNGGAQVIGLEDTTINGSETAFLSPIPGLRNVIVNLNGGNDDVDLTASRLNGAVTILDAAGDDHISVRNSSLVSLNIQAGPGNDLAEIDSVFVRNSTTINTGAGQDTVAVYSHSVGGDITIQTGSDLDTVAIDQLGMFGRLVLNTGAGSDQVLVSGESYIGDSSEISLGDGDDFLAVLPQINGGISRLSGATTIVGGSGNDSFAFDAGVVASEISLGGNDSSTSGFESTNADISSPLDQVFEQLAEEGLDPTVFGAADSLVLALAINDGPLQFTEGQASQLIAPNLTAGGVSDTVVNSATVAIGGFVAGQDVLEFVDTATISGQFDNATGILTLTGTGSLDEYQAALRSVTYRNTSEAPDETARTLDITLETSEASLSESRPLTVIAVDDAPVIDITIGGGTLDLDAGGPAILIFSDFALTDVDSPDLASASITITEGIQPGDVLEFAGVSGIAGDFDSTTGTLILNGPASIVDFQAALQSVVFNVGDATELGQRTIQIEISDGQTVVTDEVIIDVIASQSLGISTTAENQQFRETDPATVIDNGLTIDGNVDSTITSAEVSIASGFSATRDSLSFTPVGDITGSFDSATGILSLTGDGTVADYQEVLRSVSFENSSFGDFGFSTDNRVVEFSITSNDVTTTATREIVVSEIGTEQELFDRFLEINDLTAQQTASGLNFVVQQEGDGNFPNENSFVTVNYRGTFLNGEEFDANELEFSLQSVIEGWTEGIPLFSTGGSGLLLIPSDLGYGEFGLPGIVPPNTPLLFEVELIGFRN